MYLVERSRLPSEGHAENVTGLGWQHASGEPDGTSAGLLFSATVVHELSQPLAAMTLDTSAVKRWLEGPNVDLGAAIAAADRARANADRALAILAKARARTLSKDVATDVVDLKILVPESMEFVEGEAAAADVNIRIDIERNLPLFRSDALGIQQLLVNLAKNAIEAMRCVRHGRELVIRARRSDGSICLVVEDTGHGLVDRGKALFQPFCTTRSDGMGIGLTVCRSIVASLGGTIEARDNEGPGAAFIIWLPTSECRHAV